MPPSGYDLVALLMAETLDRIDAQRGGVPAADTLRTVARERGQAMGAELERSDPPLPAPALEALLELVAARGYEPRLENGVVTLRNCPFRRVAESHRPLVCAMNYELINGLAQTVRPEETLIRLDPGAGRCCVRIERKSG
jgi:predicted ArsR family transcriptional regulator